MKSDTIMTGVRKGFFSLQEKEEQPEEDNRYLNLIVRDKDYQIYKDVMEEENIVIYRDKKGIINFKKQS